jgi:N-acetylglutamate synthase-like GNAT family acetyltransferase
MVQWVEKPDEREAAAREVLEALPDWFGIPESREASIRDSRAQPFWADLENGTVRGVLALRETSPYTAELAAMGVLPAYHRQGIGRALFAAFHQYAREK